MITRAVARGELPDTVDPRLAVEMLVSPVHFRVVLTREPIEPGMPERLVDTLLGGLTVSALSPPPAGPAR